MALAVMSVVDVVEEVMTMEVVAMEEIRLVVSMCGQCQVMETSMLVERICCMKKIATLKNSFMYVYHYNYLKQMSH